MAQWQSKPFTSLGLTGGSSWKLNRRHLADNSQITFSERWSPRLSQKKWHGIYVLTRLAFGLLNLSHPSLEDEILILRATGLGYKSIALKVGCSRSLVRYYCTKDGRLNNRRRRQRNVRKLMIRLKLEHGGRCKRCGYGRCLEALDFHHRDPSKKSRIYGRKGVSTIVRTCSYKKALEEAAKCDLICANCHREIHAEERLAGGKGVAPFHKVLETSSPLRSMTA